MTKTRLIGLCGYQGAGKTTLTEVALNLYPEASRFIRIGFSDPIYRMLEAFGVPAEVVADKTQWNDPQPMLCGRTVRHAAQTLGTEWGREYIDQTVWINNALARADQLIEAGRIVIIDNVRFPNEQMHIWRNDGIIIGVHREGLKPNTDHASEAHIDGIHVTCDHDFTNTGADLEANARRFFELLKSVTA